jgi:hypothetical protein
MRVPLVVHQDARMRMEGCGTVRSMPGLLAGSGSKGSGSAGAARSPVARRQSKRPNATPTAQLNKPAVWSMA